MTIEEIKKAVLAEALNKELAEITDAEVEHYENCDYLTENVGRDGNEYVWYLDAAGTSVCADSETGRILTAEEQIKVFPELGEKEFTFKHEVISVPHQMPVYRWQCDSFEEEAINHRGWGYHIFNTLDEAIKEYDGEEYVPEELKELLKKGKAVRIERDSQDDYFESADKFDPEAEAREYCGHDDYTMIVVDNLIEALKIIETYHGHKEAEVRTAAREIIEKYKDAI